MMHMDLLTKVLGYFQPGRWRTVVYLGMMAFTVACATACSPASMVEVSPPSGVVDQSVAASSAGALQLMNYAINNFAVDFGGNANSNGSFLRLEGLLTDELELVGGICADALLPASAGCASGSNFYGFLNRPRTEARQAREALALYAPNAPRALQGRLYAIEAYTILLLADLYCSGIPLSTASFTGITTPTAGFTTEELYTTGAALFDTAITISADTARFVNLAKVGKGRALLGLGKFTDAAAAVQGVPTDFIYTMTFGSTDPNNIGSSPRQVFTQDNEGGNGLVWSTDPRTAIMTTPTLSSGMPYSAKYSKTSGGILDPTQAIQDNPIWLASGVEARLIEAEADLAAGGSNWLTILNILRSTCIGTAACAPVPGLITGNLPSLSDPGTADARLNLVMRERAMWLFLTGHRQGDLRRLARVYHRTRQVLWPIGVYVNPGFAPRIAGSSLNGTAYGDAVVLDPNGSTNVESLANPLYTGCFNYDP